MDVRERADQVTATAARALAGTGVVVDDVTVQQAGRRRLVRVFLARDLAPLPPDDETSAVEPLSLDEIAEATRRVSVDLDDSDVMGDAPYTLEVSSPGLDRPLTTPDHFRRNVGRLLTVTTSDGTTVTGRLVAAGAGGLRLALPTDAGAEPVLPWPDVVRAAVQVEFSRPDRKDD